MNYYDGLSAHGGRVALQSERESVTFASLAELSDRVAPRGGRSLAFCVCTNSVASVAGLLGMLRGRVVPVLISPALDRGLYEALYQTYRPQYVWSPAEFTGGRAVSEYGGFRLYQTPFRDAPEMDGALALLMTTSGSTGSPKLVRQTYRNLDANTASIARYLHISPDDRAITTLPLSYTYGLSILQSHLLAGARVILTDLTLFERDFWALFRRAGATTFGAVPYTCQMLDKLHFLDMDLPSLRYMTQAGGRLGRDLHLKLAEGLRQRGKALIVMYGATEATARMSYVPADRAAEKAGSIGIAIPGGRFALMDADGGEITSPGEAGELVYYGENVTPGYAECRADLAKGDERGGRLETGDMARMDGDGFYTVIGRKKRFLKLYGNRVNLAEAEELLSKAGFPSACTGEDDHMRIYTTHGDPQEAARCIAGITGVNRAAFTAVHIEEIPRNDAGKVLYSALP